MLYDFSKPTDNLSKMSQRFCLRWNNHQSNLLSVFDQLFHAETFTDVTLAVEGQLLKAHKMVLSACSPYFQALFLNHPEKHPIVILKDVPYSDMKSLLDFMYRGEVSVDQERLTAFLRVAESLRIKGLTEVNEEKCDLPAITNSLMQQNMAPTLTPPPQLHRIHPYLTAQRKQQSHMLMNPLLGNALTQPKRKRGRPRKLSGSSNGTPGITSSPSESFRDEYDNRAKNSFIQGSPEMMEVKMGADGFGGSGGEGSEEPTTRDDDDIETLEGDAEDTEPMASTSKENSPRKGASADDNADKTSPGLLIPKSEPLDPKTEKSIKHEGKIRVNPLTQTAAGSNSNALEQMSSFQSSDSLNNNTLGAQGGDLTPQNLSRPPVRRRVRRRANSASNDPAEQLTEMSVRGLNLFRYASLSEGIYQCTECAKENIQKTFKNKYSFQRHAFLYHEGKQRKVFPCPVCSKEFSRPDKMKNHMKTTHDCYMPKDCVLPMGFFVPPGLDSALHMGLPMEALPSAQPPSQVETKLFPA